MFENITEPGVRRLTARYGIDRDSLPYRAMQIIRTGLIVCVGELFFRAEGLKAGFAMFGRMVAGFTLASFKDGTVLCLGLDMQDFFIAAFTLLLVAAVHFLAERGVDLRERLETGTAVIRLTACLGLALFVIVFGAYGANYIPVDPIYAGF